MARVWQFLRALVGTRPPTRLEALGGRSAPANFSYQAFNAVILHITRNDFTITIDAPFPYLRIGIDSASTLTFVAPHAADDVPSIPASIVKILNYVDRPV